MISLSKFSTTEIVCNVVVIHSSQWRILAHTRDRRKLTTIGLGQYSHYRYTIETEINRYVSIRSSCCTDTPGSIISHLTFIQLTNKLKHIEFDLYYLELILCEYNYGTHCTGYHFALALVFCWIHCIDQLKTFTLLLKSKILDFETLRRVHVYRIGKVRIDYVSYRLLTVSSQP